MRIYIDQSGKVESTSKHTIVAYCNSKNKAILISASDKRKLQKTFRDANKPHMFIFKTFAVLIFLLIRNDLKHIDEIIVDREYAGRESLIKKYILELIRRNGNKFNTENVHFMEIGKKNLAHNTAISVFRKKKSTNLQVKYEDLIQWII